MKRIFFSFIVCICSYGAAAQSGFFVKNNHIEKWYQDRENLEIEVAKVMLLPEFQSVVNQYSTETDALMPYFHFIDFNNNGELDILFDGKIGTQNYVFIFWKKGDHYLVVLEQKGRIMQANLPDGGNNLNLSIWNEACCGAYINSFTQFVGITTNTASHFNTVEKSMVLKGTQLPSVRIAAPVKCTLTHVTHLRTEPLVDNQKRIAGNSSWAGNSLGIYSLNATGTIYAEMRDNRNKFWYFVRMNNESGSYIHSNRFTNLKEIENAESYFYYGWINSDDIRFE